MYDTLANGKGKLSSAIRYSGSNAYTVQTDAYDVYGRPTSTSVVLPATETNLCTAPTGPVRRNLRVSATTVSRSDRQALTLRLQVQHAAQTYSEP
ncbi:hypothetical protein QEZ54_17875 [Catellatospora sp. KI3]|uniref:hypothetical protein n=1 Tax=Catellatospora sp. KI3 TaxID=3041620 RepID=UPI0024832C67|nr:hypothetical protein [Catellatospora sp. KI3]MDI1462848.1 hypothetical protein [Catellatospora sp. KI3]